MSNQKRYVTVNGVRKGFEDLQKGDVFSVYEHDGTLVVENWEAVSAAFINNQGVWTVFSRPTLLPIIDDEQT